MIASTHIQILDLCFHAKFLIDSEDLEIYLWSMYIQYSTVQCEEDGMISR